MIVHRYYLYVYVYTHIKIIHDHTLYHAHVYKFDYVVYIDVYRIFQ